MEVKYFSYGSNLSLARMSARVPSASVDFVACVKGHSMKYRKIGRDGSAKCDLVESLGDGGEVWGVIYHIDPAEKPGLDRAEGLGSGYEMKELAVPGPDGTTVSAFTYYATHFSEGLKPYPWYVEHVLRGAAEHGLPNDYIAAFLTTESMLDPDQERHERELSIYRR
ncbi:MAG: gamma-glutamylcyclotransferase [Halioglobus sp.]|nr:gamma-glutamylcyclotransferase [Halioglobus sp.]